MQPRTMQKGLFAVLKTPNLCSQMIKNKYLCTNMPNVNL